MLFWELKGIICILNHNDSLLKGNYFKEIKSYFQTFKHFRMCCCERNVFDHSHKKRKDNCVVSIICTVHLAVCSCHVTYAFHSESTVYICLNFKELLARSRRKIWSLSDCNWTRTHNHLVHKRTLNHLVKLVKWLSCVVRTSYDKNIQLNAPYRQAVTQSNLQQ